MYNVKFFYIYFYLYSPFYKTVLAYWCFYRELSKRKGGNSMCKGFVMRVVADEENVEDSDEEVFYDQMLVRNGTRFTCLDLDFR